MESLIVTGPGKGQDSSVSKSALVFLALAALVALAVIFFVH